MYRMGKVQELRRSYRPLSALSFAMVLSATWEYLLLTNTQGLLDGGLAGMFWSLIWTLLGFCFVIISLAQMASMAPASGGQYHWVSEFALPKYQKFLSYLTGWISVVSWQAGNASGQFLTGTIIQALVALNNTNYKPQNWQGTLFMIAMTLIPFIFNIYLAKLWSKIQNLLLILHVKGLCIVVIVLTVMAPRQPAIAVFTYFSSHVGWPNMAISLTVCQLSAIFASVGSDATAHMAEEVRDASRHVPRSILWSFIFNGILAIIFLISFLFALDNLDGALNDESGLPFIYVFSNALSLEGVNVLTAIILNLVTASNISFNASTARQTFAFARDKGPPFSKWLSQVDSVKEVPVNCLGLGYASFSFFWSFWPVSSLSVTWEGFDWSVVVFVASLGACVVQYLVRGQRIYVSPVGLVRVKKR